MNGQILMQASLTELKTKFSALTVGALRCSMCTTHDCRCTVNLHILHTWTTWSKRHMIACLKFVKQLSKGNESNRKILWCDETNIEFIQQNSNHYACETLGTAHQNWLIPSLQ